MAYTQILNIDELRLFIKENLDVKAYQSGDMLKIELLLEGETFSETKVKIDVSLLKDDIMDAIESKVVKLINKTVQ